MAQDRRLSLFTADPRELDEWFPDDPNEPIRAPSSQPDPAPVQQRAPMSFGPPPAPEMPPPAPRRQPSGDGFQFQRSQERGIDTSTTFDPTPAPTPQPRRPAPQPEATNPPPAGRQALEDLQGRTQEARGTAPEPAPWLPGFEGFGRAQQEITRTQQAQSAMGELPGDREGLVRNLQQIAQQHATGSASTALNTIAQEVAGGRDLGQALQALDQIGRQTRISPEDRPVRVQGPDGRIGQFPAGTTQEQARAYFQRQQEEQRLADRPWYEKATDYDPASIAWGLVGVDDPYRYAGETATGFARGAGQLIGSGVQSAGVAGWMREEGVRRQIEQELSLVDTQERPGYAEGVYAQSGRTPQDMRRDDYRVSAARNLRNIAMTQAGQADRDQLWEMARRVEAGEPIEAIRSDVGLPTRFGEPTLPEDRGLYQAGEAISETARSIFPESENPTLFGDFGEALGTLGGFMAAGMIGGPAAVYPMAAVLGSLEQYERAKQAGADVATRFLASNLGQGPGAIQAVPIDIILRRVPAGLRRGFVERIKDVATAGGAEATVETVGNILQNVIAKNLYDAGQDIIGDSVYRGLLSGSAASTLRALALAALPGRSAPALETQQGIELANDLIQGDPRRVVVSDFNLETNQVEDVGEGTVVRMRPDGGGFIVQWDDGSETSVGAQNVRPVAQPAEGAQPPDPGQAPDVQAPQAPEAPTAEFQAPQTPAAEGTQAPQVQTPTDPGLQAPAADPAEPVAPPEMQQAAPTSFQPPQTETGESITPPAQPVAPQADLTAPQQAEAESALPPEAQRPADPGLVAPEPTPSEDIQAPQVTQPGEGPVAPAEIQTTTPEAPPTMRGPTAPPEAPATAEALEGIEPPQRPEAWEPYVDDEGNQLGWIDPETGEIFEADATGTSEAAQDVSAPEATEAPAEAQTAMQESAARFTRDLDRAAGPQQVTPAPQALEQGQTQGQEIAPEDQTQMRQTQDLQAALDSGLPLEEYRAQQRGEINFLPQESDVGYVITPRGNDVAVEYAVVDVNDLITSNTNDMNVNPSYPPALQPRNRTRDDSVAQIQEIQGKLDPRRWMAGVMTSEGSPVVGPDGIVESGNGRTIALRRAYQAGQENAQQYRQALADAGYNTAGIEQPALVRIRRKPMNTEQRVQFAREAGESPILGMGSAEAAMSDSAILTPDVMGLLQDGPLTGAQNQRFVDAFIAGLSQSDASSIRTKDGDLSTQGVNRIEAAVMAKAYGDTNLLSVLLESQDNNIRAIGMALRNAAPRWASMRDAAAKGTIAKDSDQTAALLEAVNLVRSARAAKRNVAEYVAQDTLWGESSISPMGKGFLGMFFSDAQFSKPLRGAAPIQRYLDRYIAEVEKTVETMFAETPPTPEQMLDRAMGNEQQDLFAQRMEMPDAQDTQPGRQQPGRPLRAGEGVSQGQPRQGNAADAGQGTVEAGVRGRPGLRPDGRPSSAGQAAEGSQYGSVSGSGRDGRRGAYSLTGPYTIDPAQGPAYEAAIERLRGQLEQLGIADRVQAEAYDKMFYAGREILGVTMPGPNDPSPIISVALSSGVDPTQVLRHETIHALRNLGLITPQEWRVLSRNGKRWRRDYNIDERYPDLEGREDALTEEAIAEAFSDPQRNHTGLIQQIIDRIRNFLQALGNALRGQGFTNAEQIFQRIDDGEMGAREIASRVAESSPEYRAESTPAENGTNLEIRNDGSQRDFANWIGITNAQHMEGMPGEQEKVVSRATKMLDVARGLIGRGDGPEMTTQRAIGEIANKVAMPSTIASIYPEFTPLYNMASDSVQMRDRIMGDLGERAQPYFALYPEDAQIVDKALFYGSLNGVDLQPNAEGVIEFTNDGREIYDYAAERPLVEKGETVRLTPAQSTAYRAVRNSMDRSLDLLRIQILRDGGLGKPGDPITADTIEQLGSQLLSTTDPTSTQITADNKRRGNLLIRTAEAIRSLDAKKRTGYFPFVRHGDQAIAVLGPEADNGNRPVVGYVRIETTPFTGKTARAVGSRLSRGKVNRVRKRLEAMYPRSEGYEVTQARPYNESTRNDLGIDLGTMDHLAEMAGAKDSAWIEVREKISEYLANRGWGQHLLGREGVEGFDVDGVRTLSGYVAGLSNFLVNQQYGQPMRDHVGNMPEGTIKEYAQKYVDYISQPQEEWQTSRMLTFFWHLAGNISSMFVNMTQPQVVTAPMLSQFRNPGYVSAQYARAMTDIGKMMQFKDGWFTIDPNLAPEDVRPDVVRAAKNGLLMPVMTYEMQGRSFSDRRAFRGWSKPAAKVGEILMSTYSAAERANRYAAFIMALRTADSTPDIQGKANQVFGRDTLYRSRQPFEFSRYEFARHITERTQFVAGKVNRPPAMRGIMSWVFQFQNFPINMLNQFYLLAREGNVESKQSLGMMGFMLFMYGGLFGLPFADDIKDFTELLTRWATRKDLDIEQAVYDTFQQMDWSPALAELVARGPFRGTGMDVSRRVGMGQIVPRVISDPTSWAMPLEMLLGKPTRAFEMAQQDRMLDAASEILPLFAKNPAQAYSWWDQGVRSRSGAGVIPRAGIDGGVTPYDAAARSLGFQPSRVTQTRDAQWAVIRRQTGADQYKRDIYVRLSSAVADEGVAERANDMRGVQRAQERINRVIDEIVAHNRNAPPEFMIDLNNPSTRRSIDRRVNQSMIGAEADRVRGAATGAAADIWSSRPIQ